MKAIFSLLLLLVSGYLPAQSITASIQHDGLSRNYRVHVPSTYQAGIAAPLVFNLHGYTSNAQQQEFYSGMNAIADTAGFILVYPDGVNNSWNSGFGASYSTGTDDVGFLSTLIDSISANYSIDSLRIYSCGMSNGGFMSFRLACDLQHRIAAVASVTGTMTQMQLDSCKGLRAVPILQIHGTQDATVPYNGSAISASVDATLNFWRNLNQCGSGIVHDTFPDLVAEGSTVSSQSQSCAVNTEVIHFKVANGGHTWPGALSVPGLGITNQDINGSHEIWTFFKRHVRPASVPANNPDSPVEAQDLHASPNPFSDQVRLPSLATKGRVEVYDTQGRLLFAREVSGRSQEEIYTSDWPSGMYLLRIEQSGHWSRQRLIKN